MEEKCPIIKMDWISSQGQKGNQIKCTIQAYTDSMHVTVTPDAVVPIEFQGIAITTWAHAVKTVSGLGYLEGQKRHFGQHGRNRFLPG